MIDVGEVFYYETDVSGDKICEGSFGVFGGWVGFLYV